MQNWWRWLNPRFRDRRERIAWGLCYSTWWFSLLLWTLFTSYLNALLIIMALLPAWFIPFMRWHRRREPFSTTPHKFKAECVRSTLATARARAAAVGIGEVEPFIWKVRSLGNQVTVSYLYPKHWSLSGSAVYRENVGEISHQFASAP